MKSPCTLSRLDGLRKNNANLKWCDFLRVLYERYCARRADFERTIKQRVKLHPLRHPNHCFHARKSRDIDYSYKRGRTELFWAHFSLIHADCPCAKRGQDKKSMRWRVLHSKRSRHRYMSVLTKSYSHSKSSVSKLKSSSSHGCEAQQRRILLSLLHYF